MVKQNKKGFTLVELAVVVGIIAIVVAVTAPFAIAWLPNYQLNSAARNLNSALQTARTLAIKQNTTVNVVFNNTVNPGFYFIDIDQSGAVDQPGEYRIDLGTEGGGIDFFVPNNLVDWNGAIIGAANTVTFGGGPPPFCTYNPNGTAGAGTVYIAHDPAIGSNPTHLVYAITLVTSGASKVRKYNGMQPYNQNNWIE